MRANICYHQCNSGQGGNGGSYVAGAVMFCVSGAFLLVNVVTGRNLPEGGATLPKWGSKGGCHMVQMIKIPS